MGSILAMYVTTSLSPLYAYPQTLRSRIMMVANTSPPEKVIHTTTRAASLAASGCPAPSSLETRVCTSREEKTISKSGTSKLKSNAVERTMQTDRTPCRCAEAKRYHVQQNSGVDATNSQFISNIMCPVRQLISC